MVRAGTAQRLLPPWWCGVWVLLLVLGFPRLSWTQATQVINGNLVVVGHENTCTSGPTGGTDAYACTLDHVLTGYVNKACFSFVADVPNTGPASLNLHALGAKPIVKVQGGVTTALADNDIRAGQIVQVCYDGTNMQMVSQLGNAPGGGAGNPAGSPGQAQYNNAGAFGGSSGQTLNGTQITSQVQRVTSIAANTILSSADGPVVACTSGASTITATLPSAASTTQGHWRLIKVDGGVGSCQFAPSGSDTLNGVNGPKAATSLWAYVEAELAGSTAWSVTSGVTQTSLATIASGTLALATTAIASGTCTAAQTATATGTLTTDVVLASFNGDPTGVTGFVPSTNGMLTVIPYAAVNTAAFRVCNNTLSSITPGAVSLNWRVVR